MSDKTGAAGALTLGLRGNERMNIDRGRLYHSSDDFFALGENPAMKLSTAAAIDVCERAAQYGLVVARIEGGIWHLDPPQFEARYDCIWDGADPPIDVNSADQNNHAGAEFIRRMSPPNDVFVLMTLPITG
ncbi:MULTISPECIES: colicin immunity protein [Burkholderia]|uniref:colicin immunity protein n=1 Tax=Burkholderia TaxID=32008 RepID=UPI001FC8E468|nr:MULTISPECIES: colicin immunity protein [Burkholderia]